MTQPAIADPRADRHDLLAGLPDLAPGEQRLVLDVSWEQYETLRETLDEVAGLRMTYREGVLEIMSPSIDHEAVKKMLARLLEAWAEETRTPLNGYGSATFRARARKRALEPDECYCLGTIREVPDLAIEVAVSRWTVDKLDVYAGLGVREVWVWRPGGLVVNVLDGDRWAVVPRSRLLPTLDLELLCRFLGADDQTAATLAYRKALAETTLTP